MSEIKEKCKFALQALNDWAVTYAPDMCSDESVAQAKARIHEHGTLAYIANATDQLHAAIQFLSEAESALDEREIASGLTSNGNLWRFWAEKAKDMALKLSEAQKRESEARVKAIEDVLSALTAHELYQYRPKAFQGFIDYARSTVANSEESPFTLACAAYDLAAWAGSINWRGGENQKEWLDELRRHIASVQSLCKPYRSAIRALQSEER